MPRVSVGTQGESHAPIPSTYQVSLGDDWARIEAVSQHALSTTLSDGSQADSNRVMVATAAQDVIVKLAVGSFTTGQTNTTNASGANKSGGQQQTYISPVAEQARMDRQEAIFEASQAVNFGCAATPVTTLTPEQQQRIEQADMRRAAQRSTPPPPVIVYVPPVIHHLPGRGT